MKRSRLFGVSALAVLLCIGSAQAAVFQVTKTDDTADGSCDSDCSLREALLAAEGSAGADDVLLPAGVFEVALGPLLLSGDLRVVGLGAAQSIVDGLDSEVVFDVEHGTSGTSQVDIEMLTITGADRTAIEVFTIGTGGQPHLSLNLQQVTIRQSDFSAIHTSVFSATLALTLDACLIQETLARPAHPTHATGNALALVGHANLLVANTIIETSEFGIRTFAGTGEATLRDSTIRSNRSGGLTYDRIETLLVEDSTFEDNGLDRLYSTRGGAINLSLSAPAVSALVRRSHFEGNSASSGGVFGLGGNAVLTVVDSTIRSNVANTGGAVYADQNAEVTFDRSTVADNTASVAGGIQARAVLDEVPTINLVNSTLSNNVATITSSSKSGGALRSEGAIVDISGSTLVKGSHASEALFTRDGQLTSRNFLVDGDCANEGATVITSEGGNLESPGDSCAFTDSSDQVNVSAAALAILPLLDNGGATQTHALAAGSAAIDAGKLEHCLAIDQRAELRDDGACDVGSFEAPASGCGAVRTDAVLSPGVVLFLLALSAPSRRSFMNRPS